jgi:hypothetical protein
MFCTVPSIQRQPAVDTETGILLYYYRYRTVIVPTNCHTVLLLRNPSSNQFTEKTIFIFVFGVMFFLNMQ